MKPTRVTVTSKRQITLPADFCREVGIEKGDELVVTWTDGEMRVRRAPKFPPLTKKSVLFTTLGMGKSTDGPGAREHDRVIADEAYGSRDVT